jgi:hypothetical protein
MGKRLDPLTSHAVRWLADIRHRLPASPRRKVADAVADHLQAESLPEYAWMDVGIWGRPVYRSAAEVALRLQTVAVSGDEYDLG